MKANGAVAAIALTIVAAPASAQQADAVVLVNSANAHYADAQHFIRPYLDHFGVPYSVLDIATTQVGPEIADHALIVIGHAGLDTDHLYLDADEEANLSSAVAQGSGLVNFDNDLTADGTTGRYQFVQDVFGFGYHSPATGNGVLFTTAAPGHYVSSRHEAGQVISTQSMTAASLTAPTGATVLAKVRSSGSPLFVVTSYGEGRAVQWASYDWISASVLGPVYGLDDLVWRGMVWAARKPFVMQGMPNFLTMRVDDVSGGFWWANIANEFGLKPWVGVFYRSVSDADAFDLANLVNEGQVTASVHARTVSDFFYYDHNGQRNYSDSTIASFFQEATAWHSTHGIPISRFVLPHYYEFGSNVFAGLQNWGVQFVGTLMDPGKPYGAPWVMLGPYRLYEAGATKGSTQPLTYADFVGVPGHPEFSDKFFNCVTEIRDDAGYEWYPSSTDVAGSISRGTRQTRRALDSMALATLFTHENYVQPFTPDGWRAVLAGITGNLASYDPVYVTMDYACQYLRAKHNSRIAASRFDPETQTLTTDFSGSTDVPTQFLVFTDSGDSIVQEAVVVPPFPGSTSVTQHTGVLVLLQSIEVTPANPTIAAGTTQRFAATGTYSDGSTQDMAGKVSWTSSSTSVATIDGAGVATALAPGVTTISTTLGDVTGRATLTVHVPPLAIATTSLPSGTRQAAYSAALAASGGTPPYTWSLSSGTLPTGLSLSEQGVISGTPTATGTYSFTAMVTDSAAATALGSFSISIFSSARLTVWPSAAVPANVDAGPDNAVELGVRFRSEVGGSIVGIRFYKASANTGTHVGNLWTGTGMSLASATFTNGTASGWQQVEFATPVPIAANTVYVASYHTDVGHYSRDLNYFASAGVDNPPLHALANGVSGGNGVYRYGTGGFPNLTSNASNYWVDVVFMTNSLDTTPPAISGVSARSIGTTTATIVWTTDEPADSQVEYGTDATYGSSTPLDANKVTSHSVGLSGLDPNTLYHYRVRSKDSAGNAATTVDAVFTTASTAGCPCTIWSPSATPTTASQTDTAAVELGVKFRSDVAGFVTGIRFYKGTSNTGTHVAHLWTRSGTQLASATFAGETASGWQEVDFAPVAIAANTTYVASYYAPVGRYARDVGYFAGSGVDHGSLHALADGVDGGDGAYHYGTGGGFPALSSSAANYWVDIVFATTADTDTTPPVISGVSATSIGKTTATIVWTTNEPADSQVQYGTSTAYGSSTPVATTRVTSHSVTLSGLHRNTRYHYRVRSTDAAGNTAVSVDFVFKTAKHD